MNVYATVEPGGAVETANVTIPADASVARFVAGVEAPPCRALGGIALYLVSVAKGGGALPTITWELLRRYGESDEAVEAIAGASGTLGSWTEAGEWSRRGSLVEVTGGLVTGYELRARVSGSAPLRVGLLWVVGLPTGVARVVTLGGLC